MIHGSGRWGFIFVVYLPRVDPKGPALVRFNIKEKMLNVVLIKFDIIIIIIIIIL